MVDVGTGWGTGTRFVMRGGDGDQIPSPCHSLDHGFNECDD